MEVTKERPRLLQTMNSRSFSFLYYILQKQVVTVPTDIKQIT